MQEKLVIAERFIRTLKNTVWNHMTAVSKNMYIDTLDDIVNEYSNTYPRTIKMKSNKVKHNTYIDSSKEVNDKDSRFKVGYNKAIQKYFC